MQVRKVKIRTTMKKIKITRYGESFVGLNIRANEVQETREEVGIVVGGGAIQRIRAEG
jgi:uridylate kinase